MLRAPIRRNFIEILEESYFGIDNFIVNFDDGEPSLLEVIFLPNTDFDFVIERHGINEMRTIEAPGEEYLTSQSFITSGIGTSAARLRNWVRRVHEEVVSTNPFAREISALRAELDQRMSALGHELEGYFTREEASVLK
jgi:hypothetical protein